MKIKIATIFICALLIWSATTIALTPLNTNEVQTNNQRFDTTPLPLPSSKGWMKTYGGDFEDAGYSVQQTTDGGYIIAGFTRAYKDSWGDFWVIKTDSMGNISWDKIFGGSNWDYPSDVKQTKDNGFLITGRTYSFGAGQDDVWVLKLDETGEIQWNKTFGGVFFDCGLEGQQTSDGGYIIVGGVNTHEALVFDAWLIKLDNQGDEQWNRTFGKNPQYEDYGRSVQQTSDGGYIIVGGTGSYGVTANKSAWWLIKTDAQGIEQWNRTYGGTGYDEANSVELTSDGGFIMVGYKYGIDSQQSDIWIVKTNQYGEEQWNKTYSGPVDDYGYEGYQTSDGGYIIIGTTWSDEHETQYAWLIKLDASGEKLWSRTYGGKLGGSAQSVDMTSDGGYIITGGTASYSQSIDVWLIKTDSQGKAKTTLFDTLWFEHLFQRFPTAFPLLRQLMGY
jgi:hypothetical protein